MLNRHSHFKGLGLCGFAEFRELRPQEVESSGYHKEKQQIRDTEHPCRKVIKQQFVEPVGDETILVHWFGAKGLFPSRQGAPNAKQAFGCDNGNEQQVNYSEVEVPYKPPPAKIPNPDDWQCPDVEEHHDSVEDQNCVGQLTVHGLKFPKLVAGVRMNQDRQLIRGDPGFALATEHGKSEIKEYETKWRSA